MTTYSLLPHPDAPPAALPFKLWANVDHAAAFGLMATLNIVFCVGAPMNRFILPTSSEPGRRDELWKSTCFEVFLRAEGDRAYQEWNVAPSGDWAAYDFADYRHGMSDAHVGSPPYVRTEDNLTWFAVGATIAVPAGPRYRLGLSAVMEEQDGAKSYWALAHAPGKPDFHHDDCFAARLG